MDKLFKAVSKNGTVVYMSISSNSEQVIVQANFTDLKWFKRYPCSFKYK